MAKKIGNWHVSKNTKVLAGGSPALFSPTSDRRRYPSRVKIAGQEFMIQLWPSIAAEVTIDFKNKLMHVKIEGGSGADRSQMWQRIDKGCDRISARLKKAKEEGKW